MTIEEAFVDMTTYSDSFKEVAKQRETSEGIKYRMSLSRYRNGKLGKAAMIELLEANGYVIRADKAVKESTRSKTTKK